jgi:hypothetical protein
MISPSYRRSSEIRKDEKAEMIALFNKAKKEKSPIKRQAIKKSIHSTCMSIVAARRREYFEECAANNKTPVMVTDRGLVQLNLPVSEFEKKCLLFDADKEYAEIKKQIFGKNVKLVFTSKEISNQVQKSSDAFTKKSGFSIFGVSGMTAEEAMEADSFVSVEEASVRGCGSAIKEIDPTVTKVPAIAKIIEKEKANHRAGRRVLRNS